MEKTSRGLIDIVAGKSQRFKTARTRLGPSSNRSARPAETHTKIMEIALIRSWIGLAAAGACCAVLWSCSSGDDGAEAAAGSASTGGSSAQGGSSNGGSGTSSGGSSAPTGTVGNFSVVLNPAIDETGAYTSVFGTVYGGSYPTDIIETAVAENDVCAVYKFSRHTCTGCTTSQTCTATDVCTDKPALVSVGEVTLNGVGASPVKLSAVNNNYQYAGDLAYPGFAEGDQITLAAAGDHYPAFSVTAEGVAPIELSKTAYALSSGSPLTLEWTAGAGEADIEVELNISKHGGSAGYLKCEVDDSGSLTIPANLITALIDLGVAGFPQLTLRRSTRAEAQVGSAAIALQVVALSVPTLEIEGYCSCFNGADCGSCGDTTKTSCDSVKKLCVTP